MNVSWGAYKNFEGPWYLGAQKFVLPDSPTFAEEVLAVITATEGGHWDAVNRYDSCVDTQGLIQWCNRAPQRSVDGLYAALDKANPDLLQPVRSFFSSRGYSFSNGVWVGRANPVDTLSEQQALYFLRSSGFKGAWDDESREYAKSAVAASVEVWQSKEAQRVQGEWTVQRLNWFLASSEIRKAFAEAPDTALSRAFRAMYWSFAANNPKKAAEAFSLFLRDEGHLVQPWSSAWLVETAYYLTFSANIAIYPGRYNKIRPVLEKLYGVDLPDYADTLKQWVDKNQFKSFLDPVELQMALLTLGYDLGPRGADGVPGEKTQSALKEFEASMGVSNPDGVVDPQTAQLLETALERKGLQELA